MWTVRKIAFFLSQWPLVVAMLMSLLQVHTFDCSNSTICVIEEERQDLAITSSQVVDAITSLESGNVSGLARAQCEVAIVNYMLGEAQFPALVHKAWNSSCSAVVMIVSCDHVQQMNQWAKEKRVPHLIVSHNCFILTSSMMQLNYVQYITRWRTQHKMLRELLPYLGWTRVAMLVDSTAAAELVKQLSDVYIGSLLFPLFPNIPNDNAVVRCCQTHVQHVRQQLTTIRDSFSFNILVSAPCYCSKLILREAWNLGLLSKDQFWVVVLPPGQCPGLLPGVKFKDKNLLIVQPVESGVKDAELCCTFNEMGESIVVDTTKLAEGVAALIKAVKQQQETGCVHWCSECSPVCVNGSDIHKDQSPIAEPIEEIQNKNNQSMANVTTWTICSTEARRESGVINVGHWSEDKGLELSETQLYRNTFRDFNYRTLKVGTQEAKPFVQKIGNSSHFEGFCIDILDELARALKFHYEFVEPPDKEWGAPKDDKSGNWTGIVQQVLTKEVDFGIGPFTITSIREEVIDFTKPLMEDGVGILTKKPDSDSKSMFKMFTPLTPVVWGALAGAVLLVALCLTLIERLSPLSARNLVADHRLGILGSIWLIYGSYMEQGGDPHPRSVSARILVGFWWLFTIIMTSTYTANLAAFLTVTIEDSPVNSLTDLAHSSKLKPLAKQGSNVKTLFQEAEDGVYNDIRQKMPGMPVVKSNTEALKYVLGGGFAFMTDASQLEYIMLKDCATYSLAKELFNTGGFGFVLQEDSPYMDIFNHKLEVPEGCGVAICIMKMQEAGLMEKWRSRWWSSPDPCTATGRTSKAKRLDWPSLSGLFYIFVGIVSTSVIFRIIEYWVQSGKLAHIWNNIKSKLQSAARRDIQCACAVENVHVHVGDTYITNCLDCQSVSRSSMGIMGNVKLPATQRPVLEELAQNEDGEEEIENNRPTTNININDVCESSFCNDGFILSPEFEDFDSGNIFWEYSIPRRPSLRSNFQLGD